MNGHGLSQTTVDRIAGVFERFPNVQQAILFGSRAKGTYETGSDIDLALIGRDLNWRIVGRINEALDDLLLPYRFSLIVYNESTDPEVTAHIQRVGFPLFTRQFAGKDLLKM